MWSRRWSWSAGLGQTLHMRARSGGGAVPVVVLGVLLAGCGPDVQTTAGGTTTATTAVSSTSTTSAPEGGTSPTTTGATTTASATTATATTGSVTQTGQVKYPVSQQEYTSQLVRAWGAGDRIRATHFATAPAVQQLFGWLARGGPGWSLVGCDNAGPRPACTFIDRESGRRLVLFYDAYKLGRPHAVLDLEILPTVATPTTQ